MSHREQQTLRIQELEQELRSLRDQQSDRQRQIEALLAAKLEAEAECVLARARADSCAVIEQELDRARRNAELAEVNARTARNEQSELAAQSKQFERQTNSLRDQLTAVQKALEHERNAYSELRASSERMTERMRSAHDLERSALREQLQEAQDELIAQRRQRAEWKAKAAQFSEAAAKLHAKLKQLKSSERRRISEQQIKAIDSKGETANDAVPLANGKRGVRLECGGAKGRADDRLNPNNEADDRLQAQLRSQYKEMKRKLDEMLTMDQLAL